MENFTFRVFYAPAHVAVYHDFPDVALLSLYVLGKREDILPCDFHQEQADLLLLNMRFHSYLATIGVGSRRDL